MANPTSTHPLPAVPEPSARRGLDLINAFTPRDLRDLAAVLALFGLPTPYLDKIEAFATGAEAEAARRHLDGPTIGDLIGGA